MPTYKVRCVNRETGDEYLQTVDASTEANARIRAVNDGHMLVGGLDKAPPVRVADAGSETVHLLRELLEEQRKARAYFEKRMLTQWRLRWVDG